MGGTSGAPLLHGGPGSHPQVYSWMTPSSPLRLGSQLAVWLASAQRRQVACLPLENRRTQWLVLACAVRRRRFPVGVSPTRQPLQPEAIGAVMEVTKWLKP